MTFPSLEDRSKRTCLCNWLFIHKKIEAELIYVSGFPFTRRTEAKEHVYMIGFSFTRIQRQGGHNCAFGSSRREPVRGVRV